MVAPASPKSGRTIHATSRLYLGQEPDRRVRSGQARLARSITRSGGAAPALIRRLTFDLTGLPPSPEAVDQFVADPDPCAFESLVDRLLASPHYGERWGRHWLDVVRFGESEGYETNLPRPSAWPFRDYCIRAFNRDTPFPTFVLEQLAGDTLESTQAADWLTRSATGFLVGGAHDVVGNQTLEGMLQQRADDLDDMITATGTTFLGLTLQCARCHDHKFDPITQKDYYGLQAILAGVNHAERQVPAPDAELRRRLSNALEAELASIELKLDNTEPLAQPDQQPGRPMVGSRRNVDRFAPVRAKMVRLTIRATNDQTEPCLDEVEVYSAALPGAGGASPPPRNVAAASAGGRATASSEYPNAPIHKIAHLNDGLIGNSHSWISSERGKGSITLAWPKAVTIDRVVWGRDREETYRDRLAIDYELQAALEPGRWQVVASSRDRVPFGSQAKPAPVQSAASERSALITPPGGDPRPPRRAEPVDEGLRRHVQPARQELRALARRSHPEGPGSSARHNGNSPFEACPRRAILRVIKASRAGALACQSGQSLAGASHGQSRLALPFRQGNRGHAQRLRLQRRTPSHPELLDWLAARYVEGGWRLKPIHRLIVTSATYRQSSGLNPNAHAIDRDNRLLWRVTPRRLEAESIRDAILSSSGKLDTRMGGPGYNVWEKNTNYVAIYKPRAELAGDAFRRMVYQFKPRSQPDPTFGAFDCPDAALAVPRRNVSTTALQALNLLNSDFMIRQSAFFAQRLQNEAGPDPAQEAQRHSASRSAAARPSPSSPLPFR